MEADDAEGFGGGMTWEIITGDNREVLPSLSGVTHFITDPPYDEKTHASAKTSKTESGVLAIEFEPLTDFTFVDTLLTLAAQWVICFCALERLGEYKRIAREERWIRAGIWDRRAGAAFARSDRPFQGAEGIAIMSAAKAKVFPAGAKRAVWTSTIERNDREHETQKPLPLMLELIQDFTMPGDLVVDPFCGSGTTGVACVRIGRRFIGIEANPKHADFARERLAAESSHSTLTARRAGQATLF
jgi:16S rRNA G966 N2-methylase RsmD